MSKRKLKRMASFLFEGSMLKRVWRTGYAFLGQGRESVAAHTFGMMLIAMTLAKEFDEEVDVERLLKLCLVHDLPEARTGDANAVHKRYVTRDEKKASLDMTKGLPGGEEIVDLLEEFESGESVEARIARDCDQLDMLLSLKEHLDTGSTDAKMWIPHVKARLVTKEAKALADAILDEHWAAWWMRELIKKEDQTRGTADD